MHIRTSLTNPAVHDKQVQHIAKMYLAHSDKRNISAMGKICDEWYRFFFGRTISENAYNGKRQWAKILSPKSI